MEMEKVTEKWFKEHGWEKTDTGNLVEEPGVQRNGTIYCLYGKKGLIARWDRIVYTYTHPVVERGKKSISRTYTFYARGENGFQVENRISHFNFPIETIVAALKVVGYDEFGKKKL